MIPFLVPVSYGLCACANLAPFAALKTDGSVVTWGHGVHGGDSSSVQGQLIKVVDISSTDRAFAAILSDGSVVTWGDSDYGADSRQVQHQLRNVKQLQGTDRAFCAILGDGSVVTWGIAMFGGDCSSVQEQLKRLWMDQKRPWKPAKHMRWDPTHWQFLIWIPLSATVKENQRTTTWFSGS